MIIRGIVMCVKNKFFSCDTFYSYSLVIYIGLCLFIYLFFYCNGHVI